MRRAVPVALALVVLAAAPASAAPLDALVVTETAGFAHASIPAGVAVLREARGLRVRVAGDSSALSRPGLRGVEVVVFLNTSGTVLDGGERAALAWFVRRGGGFAGVHAAADTEHGWPWYARLLGARFASHPPGLQTATLVVEDADTPATRHLPRRLSVTDELYAFDRDPRARVRVLLSLAGDRRPMAWWHPVGRGRAFYTALGHDPALYERRWFERHLVGGVRLAAGR